MKQEEKEWNERFAEMEIEHQKWMNTIHCLQLLFIAILSMAMWLTGKYCDNADSLATARIIFGVLVVGYSFGTVLIKWMAIDYWDADLNQIANGRLFATFTLISGMCAFLA